MLSILTDGAGLPVMNCSAMVSSSAATSTAAAPCRAQGSACSTCLPSSYLRATKKEAFAFSVQVPVSSNAVLCCAVPGPGQHVLHLPPQLVPAEPALTAFSRCWRQKQEYRALNSTAGHNLPSLPCGGDRHWSDQWRQFKCCPISRLPAALPPRCPCHDCTACTAVDNTCSTAMYWLPALHHPPAQQLAQHRLAGQQLA